ERSRASGRVRTVADERQRAGVVLSAAGGVALEPEVPARMNGGLGCSLDVPESLDCVDTLLHELQAGAVRVEPRRAAAEDEVGGALGIVLGPQLERLGVETRRRRPGL